MVSAEIALQDFVSTQKRLLELELRAEEEAGDSKNGTDKAKNDGRDGGFILRNIDVSETSVGLYGRTVITFGNASQDTGESDIDASNDQNDRTSPLLPAHRLK